MIYFGIRKDFGSVEEIAAKHFENTSDNHWATKKPIDGVHRGFHLFPDAAAPIPEAESCGAVIRTYQEDVLRMLEGERLGAKLEQMKEMYEGCVVHLEMAGPAVRMYAELPLNCRKPGEKPEHPSIEWSTADSRFAKMMASLWDAEDQWAAYDIGIDIKTQRNQVVRRNDIELMVLGEPSGVPAAKAAPIRRVLFDPSNYDARGNRIWCKGGGSGPMEYVEKSDGTYYAPGAEHTGEATAEACGVDLSDFADSGRD